jgi:transcriptional regulator with XRE-family HTH domain
MHPAMTQEDVAHEAGLSVRHYQKIEAGTGDPKISTLIAIAGALGTKLQTLLDRADDLQGQRRRR